MRLLPGQGDLIKSNQFFYIAHNHNHTASMGFTIRTVKSLSEASCFHMLPVFLSFFLSFFLSVFLSFFLSFTQCFVSR